MSDEKISLEIKKLTIETKKLQEELNQLQVPFYKKSTYLSIFLPVTVTLVIGFFNFKSTREQKLAGELEAIKKENEKLAQQTFEMKTVMLEQRKRVVEEQIDEKEKELAREKAKVTDFQTRFSDYQRREKKLAEESAKYKRKNDSIIVASADLQQEYQKQINDLLAKKEEQSRTLTALEQRVTETNQEYDQIQQQVSGLTVKSQLLSKISKDLKGLMVRFYTNWSKNNTKNENESLRAELVTTRQEMKRLYAQLGTDDYKNEFESMDKAIGALIEDGAFRKVQVTANIKHVEDINKKSDILIERMQKDA